jgi:branched-chain amino acid transport system permease protein
VEILIYGLINSVQLALMAVGFSLVYGISRLPNFAHGALYVTAGFATWTFYNTLGLHYGLSILLAVVATAALGAGIYQVVLIRVRGMPIQEIIASYAIGLAILEGLRWAGLKGMTYTLPAFVSGTVEIAGVIVDYQRLTVVGVGLRAIAQDERAALTLGIDSDRAALVALALGSALAALAAVVILPLGNITVATGYDVLIYALAVCVVGGLGSWAGSILAALVIGFAQILTVAFVKPHFQMVVALAAILVVLLVRPSGLLGKQKELEERV